MSLRTDTRVGRAGVDWWNKGKGNKSSMRTFYEFFAGGGMARAGLGEGWRCLFANDFDEKKALSYKANWGSEHLVVTECRKGTGPGFSRVEAESCVGLIPLPGLSLARRWRRTQGAFVPAVSAHFGG